MEINSKSIMVGDWVIYQGHPNKVIRILPQTVPFNDEGREVEDLVHIIWNGVYKQVNVANIEPIPLTDEILKANGIKYQWGMPWYQGGFDGVFELHYSYGDGINLGEKSIDVKLPIRYVHELQHALKMCGLDKEIAVVN